MEGDPESTTVNTLYRSSTRPTLEELGVSHSALAYDKKFICSPSCMLMFGEIVCGLLVWTLLGGTEYLRVPGLCWVMFVSVVCWVLTVCLLLLYLTTAHIKIPHIPWTVLDAAYRMLVAGPFWLVDNFQSSSDTEGLCFNSSATVLYMTAAVINAASVSQAIRGRYYYISWIASTVLAFIVVLCYAANVYVSYKSWRSKTQDD